MKIEIHGVKGCIYCRRLREICKRAGLPFKYVQDPDDFPRNHPYVKCDFEHKEFAALIARLSKIK